ncbi:low molecular weight protein arginine phosphatase [Moorella sp. Hama-1]|uniref:low molecular weight protein arginine phosphatase n=1 Tax=Moorella sp. Hama-1 TaxID=2138101 RepID=UPI000D652420|nr:low molecular weight protein arginine phosphatase [Moorella sp. Hama-1]MDN5362888.1 protein arginine phosphatase [Moorella sp. (in: firmicutes)]BCV23041.1 protein-tyrosine-phosphatase [Moorella sp. Hama-1]
MPGILFVCTGNTCRSSMAAALAAHLAATRSLDANITSAGLAAREGEPATPAAVQALAEMGLDLSSHRARQLTAAMVKEADLILTMEAGHRERILRDYPAARGKTFTLKEYVQGPVDPALVRRRLELAGEIAAREQEFTAAHRRELEELDREADSIEERRQKEARRRQLEAELAAGLKPLLAELARLQAAADLDIADPYGRSLEVYRATARELGQLIGQALDKFSQEKK